MKNVSKFFIVSLLAVILAGVIFVRVYMFHDEFEDMVQVALETTDGYDQEFIDMVNRLENELALRASFGYRGEKDPMTGQRRSIVKRSAPKKTTIRVKGDKNVRAPKVDLFRLSAIIYNDEDRRFTALLNIGERSVAVEVGDVVSGRKILSISKDMVDMKDAKFMYRYGIEGTLKKKSLTKDRGPK